VSRFFSIFIVVAACQAQPSCDLDLDLDFPGYGGDDDSCPAGSNFSSVTPNGLDLELTPVAFDWFPDGLDRGAIDVAIGGSAALTVLAPDGTPLSFAYEASSENAHVVAVGAGSGSGSAVTLQGLAVGNACIDVTDPTTGELFGGVEVGAETLREVIVVPAGNVREVLDNDFGAFAFAMGDLQIGVGYLGGYANSGPRLIDLGATLELDRATQTDWQTLAFPSATAGSYTMAATVGSASASASFDVVDRSNGAREVVRLNDAPADLGCFAALTGSQAFIVGLSWSFSIDGAVASASPSYANCVAIPVDGIAHTITALAGGQFTSISAMAQ
jgi:hypothetical protein